MPDRAVGVPKRDRGGGGASAGPAPLAGSALAGRADPNGERVASEEPPAFPVGTRFVADASLERHDSGRLLIGGSPRRAVRVSEQGARLVEAWLCGVATGPGASASQRRLARRLADAAMLHPVPAGDDVDLESVTAVVAVRDDPRGLAQALSALAQAVAVVVVDDASRRPDAIAEVAERFGARLVRRSRNGGPGAARNTGLACVSTETALFIDADAAIDRDSLRRLLAHLRDERVVACAPRVRSAADASQRVGADATAATTATTATTAEVSRVGAAAPVPEAARRVERRGRGLSERLIRRYESLFSPLDMGAAPSPVGPGRRVGYLPAAVLAVRADAARRIGGFDESLRWGEDVDFVWRLVQRGLVVRYNPSVEAWHRPRRAWCDWAAQRRHYGASAAPLAKRHPGATAPAGCTRWAAACWTAAALGFRTPALLAAISATLELARRLFATPTSRSQSAAAGPASHSDRLLSEAGPVRRLRGLTLAARLTLRGHVAAGQSLARAVTRTWLPLALPAALMVKRLRPALCAAVIVPVAADLRRAWTAESRQRPCAPTVASLGAYAAIGVADDLCYCWGLWEGVISQRTPEPLLMNFTRQPRLEPAVRAGTGAVGL